GAGSLGIAAARGEIARWNVAATPASAWAALAYLAAFGSVLGFSAYLYLLRHRPPAIVATYAFVNPIVAMFIGYALGGETLTPRPLGAPAGGPVAGLPTPPARAAPRGEGVANGLGAPPARRP